MSDDILYYRSGYIEIGTPGQKSKIYNMEDGWRFYFEVEKTKHSEPNTCKVKMYNLSEETRRELEEDGYHITVFAGYLSNARILFTGDVMKSQSTLDGADWITEIEAGDGHYAYKNSFISQSFESGTSYKQLYRELVSSLEIPTRYMDEAVDIDSLNGVSYCGYARDYLDNLAVATDHIWSIQNESFQLIQREGHNQQQLIILDAKHGLIGSPERIDDDVNFNKGDTSLPKYLRPKTIRPGIRASSKKKKRKKKNKTLYGTPYKTKSHALRANTLMQPDIIPGCQVQLDSVQVQGTYIVEKVAHKGDTFDNQWETELVLR